MSAHRVTIEVIPLATVKVAMQCINYSANQGSVSVTYYEDF